MNAFRSVSREHSSYGAFNAPTSVVVPAANLLQGVAKDSGSISGQVLEPFLDALTCFLRTHGCGKPVLLSKIASSGPVQIAWATLQQKCVMGKAMKMRDVILQRPERFKVLSDHCNQPCVQLIGGTSTPNVFLEASAAIMNAVGKRASSSITHSPVSSTQQSFQKPDIPKAPDASLQANSFVCTLQQSSSSSPLKGASTQSGGVGALRPEQISAIEAHLRKNNGQDKLSKIGSQFGVKKIQLASYFTLVPSSIDCLVVLTAASEKVSVKGIATDVVDMLDRMLSRAFVPSRRAIGDIMVFCFNNTRHAAPLSRRLATSLGEKGLNTDVALTRLYVVNDILSNSTCSQPDADRFSSCLQDLLPEAFEQLGREWFRRIENHSDRSYAERKIQSVLNVWKQSSFFPPLFTYGLESLLFAPVLEDANMNPLMEHDQRLRQKMARWFSAVGQVRLPSACRIRGLAGKALSTAACRSRLCHFERFWYRPGIVVFEDEDLFGDDIPLQPSILPAKPSIVPPSAAVESISHNDFLQIDGEAIDVDGEILSHEDLVAMELSLDGEAMDVSELCEDDTEEA